MSGAAAKRVSAYLDRLEAALAGLPRPRRKEIVAEIEAHIAELLGDGDATEAEALNALERVGDPEEIAREAGASPVGDAQFGGREAAALILLPLGGFFFGIGWVLGVGLLWSSSGWTTREKLAGTLLPPGGWRSPS